jgi:hypothetical protein
MNDNSPEKFEQFGVGIWQNLTASPLGALPKRELELKLISPAIEAGLIKDSAADLAQKMNLTLKKAQTYVIDLALRRPRLSDSEAKSLLVAALEGMEIVIEANHLSIPLKNASLQLWLEQRIAANSLHPGETLRGDLIKLSPYGLGKILETFDSVGTPAKHLAQLSQKIKKAEWADRAKHTWTKDVPWSSALQGIGSIAGVLQAVIAVLKY